MKNPGIIAILKTGLYKSALKQVLHDIQVEEIIDFKDSLQECINGICKPKYLILESNIIPNPIPFSLEKLKTKNPSCKILVLSSGCFDSAAEVYVDAVILPTDDDKTLTKKFQSYFSSRTKKTIRRDNTLSDREIDVVQLVALGKTNKEISDALYISTHTVITHRKNITSKLGIKTIAGLAVYAVLNGIIDPDQVNS